MRRPWNSCVQLSLRQSCVKAALVSGWRQSRRTRTFSRAWNLAYDEQQPGPEDLAMALEQAVGDLLTALGGTHPLSGSALDVNIADAFVHFDVAEGNFGADSEDQLQAVAKACASDVLGEGEALEVRWQLQADERHLLVCAIPSSVMTALRHAASRHAVVLRHVKPTFACGWNRHARGLRKGVCAFAVGDEYHTLVALVRDGVVEAVDAGARPGETVDDPDTPTRLDAQVQRLVSGMGIDPGLIQHFVAIRHGRGDAKFSPRWTVHANKKAEP